MPAKQLYTSDWFLKASAYASREADVWFILSAEYGLVRPERVIRPYDKTLNKMRSSDRRAWAERVTRALRDELKPGDRVMILAGIKYREHILEPIKRMGCSIEVPMEGLGIGEQKGWLKRKLGA